MTLPLRLASLVAAALVGSWRIVFVEKVSKKRNVIAVYGFRLFRALVLIAMCSVTPFIVSGLGYPLFTLTNELHQAKFPLKPLSNDIEKIDVASIEAAVFKYMYNNKASHGYGLFRSMTGVGADEQFKAVREDGDKWGWAGKPPR